MLGSHLIFSTYGFWPPNDPRGSWSTEVRAYHLYRIGGDATTVNVRHSIAARPHDKAIRLATKRALKRPAVELTGMQARATARGIAEMLPKLQLTIHALAILPDHIHLVAADHAIHADKLIEALKRAATRGMNAEGFIRTQPIRDRTAGCQAPGPPAAGRCSSTRRQTCAARSSTSNKTPSAPD